MEDSAGTVYVADGAHRIRTISPSDVVSTLAGVGTLDTLTASSPQHSSTSRRVRRISPDGAVTTLAGSTQGNADGTGATRGSTTLTVSPQMDPGRSTWLTTATIAYARSRNSAHMLPSEQAAP